MEASHLIDAFSGSFFALLGIWAAVGQRHWFMRVVVVAIILLACLLIPAYGVVIEFGLAIAIITAGVWIVHGRKKWQKRFSMQTVMLVMVVAAVISAILGSAPEISTGKWLFFVRVAASVSSIALAFLWIVFGSKPRWWLRITLTLLGFALVAAFPNIKDFFSCVTLGTTWEVAFSQLIAWNGIPSWFGFDLRTVSLAASIVIAVLLLARGSRWFNSDTLTSESSTASKGWTTIVCRTALTTLMLAIFLPLCYLGYRLATPVAFPEFEMPEPNGYDDLLAAGEMLSNDIFPLSQRARKMDTGQLGEELAKLELARTRIREAFDKEVQVGKYGNADDHTWIVATRCCAVLEMEAFSAASRREMDQFIEISLQMLRFRIAIEDGFGYVSRSSLFSFPEFANVYLGLFNAKQCKEYAQQLWNLSQSRMPIEKRILIENYLRENNGWGSHLRRLSKQWSGRDPNHFFRQHISYQKANSELHILQLAIYAYELAHNKLPNSLDDLMPEFISTDMKDPLGNQPYQYQVEGSEYLLFSVGRDGIAGKHQVADRKLKTPDILAGDDIVVFGNSHAEPAPKAAP